MNPSLSPRVFIHPEDHTDVRYWAKKWGVSARQIFDAIIDTGSLDPGQIKQVLRERDQLNNVFYRLFKAVKAFVHPEKQQAYQGPPVLRRIR
jgi:hypothetical protein